MEAQIAIIEFGSQHTLQIARVLRELGHYSIIVKPEELEAHACGQSIRCIIGSGGLRSVYEPGAPLLSPLALPGKGSENPLPYLGICYGMQASMYQQGGVVEKGIPEYACEDVRLDLGSELFLGLGGPRHMVWMSHGDHVKEKPEGYDTLGVSSNGQIAAVGHRTLPHFGVQFHPEVSHTSCGKMVLRNFVETIAGCTPNYEKGLLRDIIANNIKTLVGDDVAILLYSGGVDSTTVGMIAQQVLGEQLFAVTFDAGHLRENEVEEIERNAKMAGINLHVVECEFPFIADIGRTTDPEEKREAFRHNYAEQARLFAKRHGATKIIQGTIAPDRIESGMTGGARIKTHHNSAGLDFGNLIEVHPIEELYKDEVRALSSSLGLPQEIFNRPPFPGPGNFLRVVNIPVTREALRVAAWAEARVRELCSADNRYRSISQLVVAVDGKAVGVKGDARVYGYTIAVRGVRTKDFMTAEGVRWAEDMQERIDRKLTTHPKIVMTKFVPTPKPPATTEFE